MPPFYRMQVASALGWSVLTTGKLTKYAYKYTYGKAATKYGADA